MIARWRAWAARSAETLDDPHADAAVVVASLRDLARINRVFGNALVAARRLDEFFRDLPRGTTLTLLDVGTGTGDIPRFVARRAATRGIVLKLVGIEQHAAAAREAARPGDLRAVLADGATLPFRRGGVDLVLCAKLLHHLPGDRGRRLLEELNRVARRGVVVVDLRRSAWAAAGFWLASHAMGLHPATRRDGVISVFRGFTARELERICASAGIRATVRRHPGFCLSAVWYAGGTA